MNNAFEANFIKETMDKTPFSESPARVFFAKWCEINDSITPEFLSRDEWDTRGGQGILEKNNDGKQTLFLPEDLQLWEMMDVIKTIDADTLAGKPELREQRASQIAELGETFQKAGLYLNGYLPDIQDGKNIASALAQEFYNYGLSLGEKVRADEEILETVLTNEDKQKLDEWLLGKTAYQKRMDRLGENPSQEQIEARRKELIQVYFKALARKGYKAEGEKPWETKTGPMWHLQDKTRQNIIQAVETPERELKTAIFRRGVEKLVTEMKEVGWRTGINEFFKTIGLDISLEQRKLYDVLQISKLKQELEEAKKSGDVEVVAKKEIEIAGKIQKEVCGFPYKSPNVDEQSSYPSKIAETQFINCVGSAILGGGLLDEIGIKYLHASVPGHSLTFLITGDNKVYWQDFTPSGGYNNNREIADADMGEGGVKVKDIAAFANNNEDGEMFVTIPDAPSRGKNIILSKPEIGLQAHVLNNAGKALYKLGKYKEAIEAYKQGISLIPKDSYLHNGAGQSMSKLGRHEEAIEEYKQAIVLDPEDADYYDAIGDALYELGRLKEAIKAYKQVIALEPEYAFLYGKLGEALEKTGEKNRAIEAYEKFIELWDGDPWLKVKVKATLAKLKQK